MKEVLGSIKNFCRLVDDDMIVDQCEVSSNNFILDVLMVLRETIYGELSPKN